MTTCDDFQQAIERRAAGKVDAGVDRQIADHLSSCAECRAYEDLTTRTETALAATPVVPRSPVDPEKLMRRAKWRAAAPVRRLAWSAILVIAMLTIGVMGKVNGYVMALGLLLAVGQSRWRAFRAWKRDAESLFRSDVDLLASAEAAARREMVGALLSAIFYFVLALVFAVILPFAKDRFVTGSVAAILFLLALWKIFVVVPSRSREIARYEGSVRS